MASVRFTDLQSRPTEFLDFTSLTLDEFQQLDVHFVNPSPVFCLDKTGDCGHSQTRHSAVLPDTRQGWRLCQFRMRPPSLWRMRTGPSWQHSPAPIPLPKPWRSVVG
jgi:hypothetical protein